MVGEGVRSGSFAGERKGRHARPKKTRNERLNDRAWANSRQSPRILAAHATSTRKYRMTRHECGATDKFNGSTTK
jgi:hypothetical protein